MIILIFLLLSCILCIFCIFCVRYYFTITKGICKSSVNLKDKTIVITGANSGIGFEAAKDFAKRGARIILACRNLQKGDSAAEKLRLITNNNDIFAKQCDLANLSSIRKFADDFNNNEKSLHILICNAGTGSDYGKHLTCDGYEIQFQTNYLGHFLLVNLLLNKIKSTVATEYKQNNSESTSFNGRIVFTSSLAHRFGKLDIDNMISFEKYVNHPFLTYADTKLANIIFMKELSRRLINYNIIVNALHPGTIYTNIVKENKIWYLRMFLRFLCFLYNRSAEDGAQTIIHLSLCDDVKSTTGQYFADCEISKYNTIADDPVIAKNLWEISKLLVYQYTYNDGCL